MPFIIFCRPSAIPCRCPTRKVVVIITTPAPAYSLCKLRAQKIWFHRAPGTEFVLYLEQFTCQPSSQTQVQARLKSLRFHADKKGMKKAFARLIPLISATVVAPGTLLAGGVMATSGESESDMPALVQTQELLKDRESRAAASKSGDAQKTDAYIQQMTGNAELTDEVYELAAEVFSQVVKDSKGDSSKMQKALDDFSRNPASFAEKWTPEQKAKLQKLSDKMPKPLIKD